MRDPRLGFICLERCGFGIFYANLVKKNILLKVVLIPSFLVKGLVDLYQSNIWKYLCYKSKINYLEVFELAVVTGQLFFDTHEASETCGGLSEVMPAQ